jgi:hypothetical protein
MIPTLILDERSDLHCENLSKVQISCC